MNFIEIKSEKIKSSKHAILSAVFPLSKVKPELIYAILKLISKAVTLRCVPFFAYNFKCDILFIN
jgi:hypothetical protein